MIGVREGGDGGVREGMKGGWQSKIYISPTSQPSLPGFRVYTELPSAWIPGR